MGTQRTRVAAEAEEPVRRSVAAVRAAPGLATAAGDPIGHLQRSAGNRATAALLRAINTEASLIVVEHDMQFIRMLEGLVTVFYQGRVLIEDTIDAVLADAKVREVYLGTADSHG